MGFKGLQPLQIVNIDFLQENYDVNVAQKSAQCFVNYDNKAEIQEFKNF